MGMACSKASSSKKRRTTEEKSEAPAGGMPPRKWLASTEPPRDGQRIRSLHWNILADKLSGLYDPPESKKVFVHATEAMLRWDTRVLKIVAEIKKHSPDCFTICELDKFDDVLKELGGEYEGLVQLRTGKKDGSGVFWKAGKLKKGKVLQESLVVGDKTQDQIVLAVELLTADGKARFVQATTHLKSSKSAKGEALRQQQIAVVLDRVAAEMGTERVLLNTDLNSSHVTLVGGATPLEEGQPIPDGDDSYKPLAYPAIVQDQRFGFRSAYQTVQGREPWATSVKIRPDKKYQYCIDYLFASQDVQPQGVLQVYQPGDVPEIAFPNADYPSDHMCIVADYIV